DVGEDRICGDDARPPVVDDGYRTMTASVGATPARLDVSDDTFLATECEMRVALERREQIASWTRRARCGCGAVQMHRRVLVAGDILDPAHEGVVGLTGDGAVGDVRGVLRIQAVARDGKIRTLRANRADASAGDAHRG